MKNETILFEVEIKSKAIIKDGKKGFITYFRGGTHKQIIKNCRKMYPQFMKPEDKPVVNITTISQEEYDRRLKDNMVYQKGQVLEGEVEISEIMGD